MTKAELAKAIYKASYLQGDFLLRSGQRSSEYFDKYRFESQPHLLAAIADHLAPLVPQETEALAALEMGGIPIGTALSLKTGIPLVLVRKEAKEYGTCKFAEGLDIKGKRLCVIEDVVSTGGQVLISAKDLRDQGALVEQVLCVIFRGEKGFEKFKESGLKLNSLFSKEDLKSS